MRQNQQGLYLRSVSLIREAVPSFYSYPFHLKAIQDLDTLELHPKVTYIVGENGMGKSTLLEAIAIRLGFNPEGGTINFNFSTEATHSELHEYLKLTRRAKKPRDGFFFRAESYYNLATNIDYRRDGQGFCVSTAHHRFLRREISSSAIAWRIIFYSVSSSFQREWAIYYGRAGGGSFSFSANGYAFTDQPAGEAEFAIYYFNTLAHFDGLS
jgi:hypothetical protein